MLEKLPEYKANASTFLTGSYSTSFFAQLKAIRKKIYFKIILKNQSKIHIKKLILGKVRFTINALKVFFC